MPTLDFKGKSIIETYHHTVAHHRLEFDPKLSLLGKGEKPSLDGNLIIEGDNLLALKALLPTHAGRVKCVYIDPPYNTGNEGWIYNDNLTQPQFREWIGKEVGKEGEDATRHDKWCCMMWPRLCLLRELMRDDGSIWISIDDNELPNLRAIMDEIFGENMFVACIAWQKRYAVAGDDAGVGAMHEYVLAYAKTADFARGLLPRTEEQDSRYTNPDGDPRGPWASDNYVSNKSKEERPKLWYPIKHPKTGKDVWPDPSAVWRYSLNRHQRCVREGRLYWGPTGDYAKPRLKRYLSEVQEGLVPGTWWPHTECGHNDEAKKEIGEILGNSKAFPTPKPVRLLSRILTVAGVDDGDIVLDSFAGSGTTAHSALELNQDDAQRTFVLIQQKAETLEDIRGRHNICKAVTAERVRRAAKGYKFEGTETRACFNERLTLTSLKKSDEVLARALGAAESAKGQWEKTKTEVRQGELRVVGSRRSQGNREGLGGEFTYARVAEPLFTEYRDLGKELPSFEDLAKYIFYTETSRDVDLKRLDPKTGFIGSTEAAGGTSYYLLYTPNDKADAELSAKTLNAIAVKDKSKHLVVYTEKLWLHNDDIRAFQRETGRRLRTMIVPFDLK